MAEEKTVQDRVEEVLTEEKFDFVKAAKGRGYPTQELSVYLDDGAIVELVQHNSRMQSLADTGQTKAYEALEKETQRLLDKVEESKYTIHLRGVAPKRWEEIYKDEKTNDVEKIYLMVAESIEKVVSASGAVDDSKFTSKKVETLKDSLPVGEWGKLVSEVQGLAFTQSYFQEATDAGFLPPR